MTAVIIILWIAFSDTASIKAEPDLEKRSEVALANADHNIDLARQSYNAGDLKAEQAALDEVGDSVGLSYEALGQSHKTPRKSRYYKSAELKVRALLRRLTSLRDEVDVDHRPAIDVVMNNLQQVHDHLLTEIMSKKK